MSATLGTMLHELQPGLTMQMFERLDSVSAESSDAMNNAGTGHSGFAELNYTPETPDGGIDTKKAVDQPIKRKPLTPWSAANRRSCS